MACLESSPLFPILAKKNHRFGYLEPIWNSLLPNIWLFGLIWWSRKRSIDVENNRWLIKLQLAEFIDIVTRHCCNWTCSFLWALSRCTLVWSSSQLIFEIVWIIIITIKLQDSSSNFDCNQTCCIAFKNLVMINLWDHLSDWHCNQTWALLARSLSWSIFEIVWAIGIAIELEHCLCYVCCNQSLRSLEQLASQLSLSIPYMIFVAIDIMIVWATLLQVVFKVVWATLSQLNFEVIRATMLQSNLPHCISATTIVVMPNGMFWQCLPMDVSIISWWLVIQAVCTLSCNEPSTSWVWHVLLKITFWQVVLERRMKGKSGKMEGDHLLCTLIIMTWLSRRSKCLYM